MNSTVTAILSSKMFAALAVAVSTVTSFGLLTTLLLLRIGKQVR